MLQTASRLAARLHQEFLSVHTIPQFREIKPGDTYTLLGAGIVKLLASWHHPKIGRDADRRKFDRVQQLLQKLLSLPEIELEVSNEEPEILVTNDTLRLPLAAYGTGVHELIILAIAVLSHEGALVCIEEPEIHLHPLLQRRFFEFLRTETSNCYVITTHSPALISPDDDVAVTHLWLENGVTKSRRIETAGHSLEALRDLGAKASDLLQANSVIWVEGPSDRIYLNRWLTLLHPELREWLDYAVMFYGGRLLSHVSFERETNGEAEDLIRLLRVNQHSAILIDSDRRKATSPVNSTKERVRAECETAGITCWITSGREIENYLPVEAVVAAYTEGAETRPTLTLRKFGSLEDSLRAAFKVLSKRKTYYNDAKPQMARRIASHITTEQLSPEIIDWVGKLARMIRHDLAPVR